MLDNYINFTKNISKLLHNADNLRTENLMIRKFLNMSRKCWKWIVKTLH